MTDERKCTFGGAGNGAGCFTGCELGSLEGGLIGSGLSRTDYGSFVRTVINSF